MARKRKILGPPCSSGGPLNALWPPTSCAKMPRLPCFRNGSSVKIRSSSTRMAILGTACSSKAFNCLTASVRRIACASASLAAICRSSRPNSCPTVAFVFRRTRVAAVLILGFASDARIWSRPLSSGGQEQNSLIGLTSFITRDPPMLPKLNRRRAQFVLCKIDEILAWEQRKEAEKDTRFVELGRYLCEVRAGQYWRLENLKSFDEFLERRFPESRRKAYYLMSIRGRASIVHPGCTKLVYSPKNSSGTRWRRSLRGKKPNPGRLSISSSTRARSR